MAALVRHWIENELNAGTVKNRMAAIRWWAEKVGLRDAVAKSNDHYGIPVRRFVNDGSKARRDARLA